jgi:hypothetical protein
MTEAEARARIIMFANATEEPALASEELDILLSMAKRVDTYTVLPSEVTWTPTWDLNYAIAQAWLVKAGKLSSRYLFMTGGKMLSRQQYYDHCMKMYHKFAMKAGVKAVRLTRYEDPVYADNNA